MKTLEIYKESKTAIVKGLLCGDPRCEKPIIHCISEVFIDGQKTNNVKEVRVVLNSNKCYVEADVYIDLGRKVQTHIMEIDDLTITNKDEPMGSDK